MANSNLRYARFNNEYTHATLVDQHGVPCVTISPGTLYPVLSDGVQMTVFYNECGELVSIYSFVERPEIILPRQIQIVAA